MIEVKDLLIRSTNSIMVFLVSLGWMLLLPNAQPEDGEASFMMYWLGINALLMHLDEDEFSQVPNPHDILAHAALAPGYVLLYLTRLIHGFSHKDPSDE